MITIVPYEDKYEQVWDEFITSDAINGTFLQSRNFLNYHPKDRFVDSSCLLFKENKLAAVVPGCLIDEDNRKIFYSHKGSTFGGLVVHKKYYNASDIIAMIKTLESYLLDCRFQKSVLKITPDLFCKEKSDLLQYALLYCGYNSYSELSTYIDFENYNDEIINNFSPAQRNKLNQSFKHNMTFKVLDEENEIIIFYDVLRKNLDKFNVSPIHSIKNLLEFKNARLKDIVEFYGVFYKDKMVAGGMMFKFYSVIHAQNLNADPDYLKYKVMPYLYYSVISHAKKSGYTKLSWGISTEEQGTILNESLLAFKESFGSKYALNRGFYKILHAGILEFDVFSKEYLEKSWGWLNDPEIRRLTDTPTFTKEEQLAWYSSLSEKKDYRVWGISIGGAKIGVVGLKKITNNQAEFFTYIGEKSFWGKKLGMQILSFIEDFAKNQLKLKLLTLKVLNDNIRAINLYRRYGFSVENKDDTYSYMIMVLSL